MLEFKQAGYEVVGEPREVATKAVEVLAGTAEALPDEVAGRRFDVVLLSHVLERCETAGRRNVQRMLEPKGAAIIEVREVGVDWKCMSRVVSQNIRAPGFYGELIAQGSGARGIARDARGNYSRYMRQFSPLWLAAQPNQTLGTILEGERLEIAGADGFRGRE